MYVIRLHAYLKIRCLKFTHENIFVAHKIIVKNIIYEKFLD